MATVRPAAIPQANYTDFNASLRQWLRQVWQRRRNILFGAKTEGRMEGADLIYDLYNDPAKNNKVAGFQDFLQAAVALVNDNSDLLEKCYPQDGEVIPADFYHFEPFGYAMLRPRNRLRVYVHTAGWQASLAVCQVVVDAMRGPEGVTKFKIAGPGFSANRGDSVVVWLTNQLAVDYLIAQLKRSAGLFSGSVPPGVKEVVPGLGWSEEPPETVAGAPLTDLYQLSVHSFGSYLAGLMFFALEQTSMASFRDDDAGYREFLGRLVAIFRDADVDPMECHRLRQPKELEHMRAVANHTLVLHSAIAGDLITLDYFRDHKNLV
jgi:hypothetical protein